MDSKCFERKRAPFETVRKDYTIEEEMDDDVEEEEEVGGDGMVEVNLGDEEKKKKIVSGCGRRGPSGGGGISPPSCQADKCGVDLTEAKRYHRRHKVCEFHSKAPVVMVTGLRQRFCQQCSRFHELAEFDEAKRSCRRRLAGHNERRRKSTAEASGEGMYRGKGISVSHQSKESQCRHADERGRLQINIPGSSSYKPFHIR